MFKSQTPAQKSFYALTWHCVGNIILPTNKNSFKIPHRSKHCTNQAQMRNLAFLSSHPTWCHVGSIDVVPRTIQCHSHRLWLPSGTTWNFFWYYITLSVQLPDLKNASLGPNPRFWRPFSSSWNPKAQPHNFTTSSKNVPKFYNEATFIWKKVSPLI